MSVVIALPEPHTNQTKILEGAGRFNVVVCGRRWGKTTMGVNLACEAAIPGGKVGWFVPEYKLLTEVWEELDATLAPLVTKLDVQQKRIKLSTGGLIECWSFDRNPRAGRGRKYHRVILDEASFAGKLEATWTKAVRPTLTDFRGDAWFLFTPNGQQHYSYKLFQRQGEGKKGWRSWRQSSYDNPHLDPAEIDDAAGDLPPEAFAQEYLAEFLADVFGSLIRGEWLDEAFRAERPRIIRRPRIGVDLGEGTGRDFTAFCVADDFGIVHMEGSNTVDIPSAARRLADLARQYNVPGDRIVFDAGARGKDLPKHLAPFRISPVAYHGGSPSKGKYFNRRSRMAMKLRHRLDPDRPLYVDHGEKSDSPWGGDRPAYEERQPPFALPADRPWWPRLREEIEHLRYEVAAGKFKLELKEDLMARLGRSPDYVDALLMSFACGDVA